MERTMHSGHPAQQGQRHPPQRVRPQEESRMIPRLSPMAFRNTGYTIKWRGYTIRGTVWPQMTVPLGSDASAPPRGSHWRTKELKRVLRSRNLGIDLLRSLSMLMVVVLHVLGQGGVLAAQAEMSVGYGVSWFVELLCYCAVDCFGLISGFVSFDRQFKLKKGISHWAQVAFYSVLITLLFKIFLPEAVGIRDILYAFFPALTQKYWYFTAYFGLMFFIPYLNALMGTISVAQAKTLLYTLLGVFSVLPVLINRDVFFARAGYSFLWVAILYLMGACIGKMGKSWELPGWKCLCGYLLCVTITFGSKLILKAVTTQLLGEARYENILVGYHSPTVVLSAVFLLLLFKELTVRSRGLKAVILFAAPLSFGVYLIHTHPLVWNHLLANRFAGYAALPVWACMAAVLATAAGIFLFCMAVDFFRSKLFRRLGPVVSPPVTRAVQALEKRKK